jgi:hypothetical protein
MTFLRDLEEKICRLEEESKKIVQLDHKIQIRVTEYKRKSTLGDVKKIVSKIEVNARQRSPVSHLYIFAEPTPPTLVLGSHQIYRFNLITSQEIGYKLSKNIETGLNDFLNPVNRLTEYTEFKQRTNLLTRDIEAGNLNNYLDKTSGELLYMVLGRSGELLRPIGVDSRKDRTQVLLEQISREIKDRNALLKELLAKKPTAQYYDYIVAVVNEGKVKLEIGTPFERRTMHDPFYLYYQKRALQDLVSSKGTGVIELAKPGKNYLRVRAGFLQYYENNIYLIERDQGTLDITSGVHTTSHVNLLGTMFERISEVTRYQDNTFYIPHVLEKAYIALNVHVNTALRKFIEDIQIENPEYNELEAKIIPQRSGNTVQVNEVEIACSYCFEEEFLPIIDLVALLRISTPNRIAYRYGGLDQNNKPLNGNIHAINYKIGQDTIWNTTGPIVTNLDDTMKRLSFSQKAKTAIRELKFQTPALQKYL